MDESGRDHVEPVGLEPTTTVRSRRPRALWAVLAVVAMATGALVVTSASDDGGQRPGLPVALGSATSPMAAEAAADSMLAWITYVAGDDLPALGGDAPAYRLAGDVSEDQVRTLADALSLDGDVVQDGPAWRVTGPDGTLEVYEGAGAQWWYSADIAGGGSSGSGGSVDGCSGADGGELACPDQSSPTTYVSGCDEADQSCPYPDCPPGTECVAALPEPMLTTAPAACGDEASDGGCSTPSVDCAVDASGNVTDECSDRVVDPPDAPMDLPSEGEARSIALELLARTGMDVDDAVVTVDGPSEAWYVMVEPRLDGVPAGLIASVSVGSGGAITSAGGYLGTPERLGDYPRLDTRATIDRANAQQAVPFGDTPTGVGIAESAVGGPYPAEQAPVPEEPVEAPAIAPCNPEGDPADPGSAACGTASEPTTTTISVPGCKPQPDGREICEPIEPGIICPQVAAPADAPLGAPETLECTPPPPEPGDEPIPMPEPEPLEIVLVDAEPSLVLLPAVDGSNDAYLVPGYRFTDEQGGNVDLPAVDDASLTGPPATDTTVAPEPVDPSVPDTIAPTDPCEVAVEEEASGTTHTVPAIACANPEPAGEEPQLGVAYPVEVLGHCANIVDFDGRWWSTVEFQSAGLAIESGTLTLTHPDRGILAGDDTALEMVASGPSEEYPGCR